MYDQIDLFSQPERVETSAALVAPVMLIASPEPVVEPTAVPLPQEVETTSQLPAVINDLEFLASAKASIDEDINAPQAIEVTDAAAPIDAESVVSAIAPEPQATSSVQQPDTVLASTAQIIEESAESAPKADQEASDKPAKGKKSSKKKQEPKDDNDDDAEKPEPVIIETMIDGHPFIVQELVFGVPARQNGYLGKYRGRWISLLIDARAFARFSEEEKAAMQGRLKDAILSPA
ncbi:hypothetical protein RYA05_02360 [Pseudomonas syringae pv. actinidiae]|nr:hypothetical protein [Pseudomonas syringae pv. actinidiae]